MPWEVILCEVMLWDITLGHVMGDHNKRGHVMGGHILGCIQYAVMTCLIHTDILLQWWSTIHSHGGCWANNYIVDI